MPTFEVDDYLTPNDSSSATVTANNAGLASLSAAVNAAGGGLIRFTPGATYWCGGFENQPFTSNSIYTYYNWASANAPYLIHLTSGRVCIEGNHATLKSRDGGSYGVFRPSDQTARTPRPTVQAGASAWSGATAYVVGDLVTSSGKSYQCIQAHSNKSPAANPTYWRQLLVAPPGGAPAWSASVNYLVDDIVTSGGSYYYCIANNINQAPPNATYWVKGTGLAAPYHEMIRAENLTGLTIRNLILDGNVQNTSVGGPFGDTGIQGNMFGIDLVSCSNVRIENSVSKNHGADGLHLGCAADAESDLPDNVVVEGCDFRNNGRNNVSITGGRNITLRRSVLFQAAKNAGGVSSSPGSGIDFEAEGGKIVRDVVVEGCYIADNQVNAIVADSGTPVDRCVIRDSTLIGTTGYALWLYRPGFKVDNCTIVGTSVNFHPGYGVGSDPFRPNAAAKFRRCLFTDDTALSPSGTVFNVNGHLVEGSIAYVEYDECTFLRAQNLTGGAGNANGPLYRNCSFIAKAGGLLTYGRIEGSETHFIEDGGTVGVPNRFNAVAGRTDIGDALDSWYYSTVASGVPTTARHAATIDRQTRDILGSAVKGDANVTLTAGTDPRLQRFTTALTANRTATLATSGAKSGSRFRVARSAGDTGGPWTLSVGGLKSLNANQWCDVQYDGAAWQLIGFGSL